MDGMLSAEEIDALRTAINPITKCEVVVWQYTYKNWRWRV